MGDNSKSTYDNNSISALKGAERVRKRPEVYLGSNGAAGARHTVIEIGGNCSDEKLAGFGDKLDVIKYDDGAISIRDCGRGVPLGWNETEQNWNYYLIYEELYAGAKYDDNQEILQEIDRNNAWDSFKITDYPYMITVGLNGLGAASTQYTSEYFEVQSIRDSVKSSMQFEKGTHVFDELLIEPTEEETGTFVKWKPDAEVFTDAKISSSWLKSWCLHQSYVSQFDVTLNDCGKVTHFPKKTAEDVMKADVGVAAKGSKFTHSRDSSGDICICQCDMVIGKGGRTNEFFNNMVQVKGGSHSGGLDYAVSDFFKGIAKEEGLKIATQDYSGKISFIVQTLCNKVSNRGQTKDSVDDYYILNCIYECAYALLKREYNKGTDWLMEAIEEVISNARNRLAVEAMAKNVKDIERSIKKSKASAKFVPCKNYGKGDPSQVEYWIVEGDSAGNNFIKGRDYLWQCVQKIRGKSLNVWKATLDKLINNQEIKDMISALGCGIDLGIEGYESFDMSKLKVGKIFIGADADIDGKHIIALIFLIIYRLFPQILFEGRLYVSCPPLYAITKKDNTDVYCFDQEELEKKKAEIGAYNIREVVRFKGLGEMDSDQLWESIANPATRRVKQVKIDPNDTEVYDTLEVLFGKSTDLRKKAILGSLVDEDLDEIEANVEELIDYITGLDMNTVQVEEIVA